MAKIGSLGIFGCKIDSFELFYKSIHWVFPRVHWMVNLKK